VRMSSAVLYTPHTLRIHISSANAYRVYVETTAAPAENEVTVGPEKRGRSTPGPGTKLDNRGSPAHTGARRAGDVDN
jgi:hypothetical protein